MKNAYKRSNIYDIVSLKVMLPVTDAYKVAFKNIEVLCYNGIVEFRVQLPIL